MAKDGQRWPTNGNIWLLLAEEKRQDTIVSEEMITPNYRLLSGY